MTALTAAEVAALYDPLMASTRRAFRRCVARQA
jgi:hypothetical protein